VEKVLPDPVELELARLDLSVDRFEYVNPEFLQILQGVPQLEIRPQDHIKDHLVLVLSGREVVEPPPLLLDFHPRSHFALTSQVFVVPP